MNRYVKALKVAIDCIKHPRKYNMLTDRRSYLIGDHEHICYPYRLLSSKDFQNCCPCYFTEDFCKPESSDCCDKCQYCGFVDFLADESGERSIQFGMNESIVLTWKE